MKSMPRITDAEWQVMKILWKNAPMTARVVINELEDSSNWKPKTVKTLLRRLVDKKAISYTVDNKKYIYYPLVNEDECRKMETETFLNKVYNGSFNLLVQNFIKEKNLSQEELEELKQIIENNKE